MDALVDFLAEAPLGAVILGTFGLLVQAVWTTVFLRRLFERNRAGENAPEELQTALTSLLPLSPIGFTLWGLALFWWSTTR